MRLGFALHKQLPEKKEGKRPVFWVHALSTGETASAIPLVKALRTTTPDASIIFSTTTSSGQQVAEKLYPQYIDSLIYSPVDILPVVRYFINTIEPDCFLLVETDLWPNLLYNLNRKKIPAILVNGRVSDNALQAYRKMAFFCRPMFRWLDALCLQKEEDREKFSQFGIEREKLHTLGNLKFAIQSPNNTLCQEIGVMLPDKRLCLLAGSTHPGEEDIIIEALLTVTKEFPSLFLIIAPRDPARSPAIKEYCKRKGLSASLRSEKHTPHSTTGKVLLLDTIGELSTCYQLADIALVGGSMVNQRGHNPLEAAQFGCPVLFGSSMEDFSEIAAGLLDAGGAFQTKNLTELTVILRQLLQSPTMRKEAGMAAKEYLDQQQGGVDRHLQLLFSLLKKQDKKM